MTSNTAEFSSSAASRAAFSSARARSGTENAESNRIANAINSAAAAQIIPRRPKCRFGFCILRILADFVPCALRKRRFPFLFLTTALLSPPVQSDIAFPPFIAFFLKYSAHGTSVTRNAGANADNCGYLRQNCKYLMFGLPSGAHCGII